ncbi:hypothetical protein TBR22_A27350 [Luteitalea sp. TBR-22]|uniref:hypothetical protein n=1 Tax=Luteitalea sp. TBR-22 TaxID=2802971 RepID=UPI001AF6506F|nr:hypothetical protein [Luteitalea sp. TBR-22]BCS33508.1 hypothetical protein TBR22_A27350 [Luteitalea sp. TBR-22]
MTADLATVLADYRTGLDAELALLAQLHDVARRQHALPASPTPEALTALALEREHLLATLAGLEQQVLPLRTQLAAQVHAVRQMPGYAGVAERHQRATALVNDITQLDDESLQVLQRADADRRAATQSLEAGEATLAAYRRILQQPQAPAGLFTQRG